MNRLTAGALAATMATATGCSFSSVQSDIYVDPHNNVAYRTLTTPLEKNPEFNGVTDPNATHTQQVDVVDYSNLDNLRYRRYEVLRGENGPIGDKVVTETPRTIGRDEALIKILAAQNGTFRDELNGNKNVPKPVDSAPAAE